VLPTQTGHYKLVDVLQKQDISMMAKEKLPTHATFLV